MAVVGTVPVQGPNMVVYGPVKGVIVGEEVGVNTISVPT